MPVFNTDSVTIVRKKGKKTVISALILALILVVVGLSLTFGRMWYESEKSNVRIEERAEQAFRYARRNRLSTNYCVFVDYGIPSGIPRVFVWSFDERKVVYRGYAMHGPGKGSTARKPVFSNVPGSHCSSLGKFEVTRRHGARNRSGYYLKGLERSNSRAYSRGIMIHGSRWVDNNTWRRYIPLNGKSCLGCVTVSRKDMRYIGRIIESEDRHILLWSYC